MQCTARLILDLDISDGKLYCLLRLRGGQVVVVVEYQAAGLADNEHKYTSKSDKDLKIITTNLHNTQTYYRNRISSPSNRYS